jgi:uncharacterized protein (DUF697 family)
MSEHHTIDTTATEHAAPAAAAEPGAPTAADLRKVKCDMTITKHVGAAMGFGFVPVPLVDFLAITGTQIDLVYRLSRIYDLDFSTNVVRGLIASMVGASVPFQPAIVSGLKLIPGIGTAAGFVAQPALAGATTYAVGRVFVEHFESGGTLLTFDAAKMKAHFERAMADGKQVVSKMRKSA